MKDFLFCKTLYSDRKEFNAHIQKIEHELEIVCAELYWKLQKRSVVGSVELGVTRDMEQSRNLKLKRSREDEVVYVCIDKVASHCLDLTDQLKKPKTNLSILSIPR
jgi:hypothetical protein